MNISINIKKIEAPIYEIVGLILFIGITALIYLLTLSVNHNEAEDSLHFMYRISYGDFKNQFHPDHLLYCFVNYFIFHFLKIIWNFENAELIIKLVNISAAVISLVVLYSLTKILKFSQYLRYFCISLVAFSFGFWWYAVECEVYIPSLLFVLLCFKRLFLVQINFSTKNHIVIGLYCAISILFHKPNTLIILVIIVAYAFIYYKGGEGFKLKEFFIGIVFFGITCGLIVGFAYFSVAIFVLEFENIIAIIKWGMNLSVFDRFQAAGELDFSFGIKEFFKSIIGFGRSYIGGHYMFAVSIFSNLIKKFFPNYILREEIFLSRCFSLKEAIILLTLNIINVMAFFFVIYKLVKNTFLRMLKRLDGSISKSTFLCLLFCTSYTFLYTIFSMNFEPQHVEMWIQTLPIAALGLCTLLKPISNSRFIKINFAIITISLFIINLFGSILPQTNLKYDYWYNYNYWIIKNCGKDDLIVSGAGWISDNYIKYYTRANVFSTVQISNDFSFNIEILKKDYQPNRIFISSSVISPTIETVRRYNINLENSKLFFNQTMDNLRLVHENNFQRIYIYKKNREYPLKDFLGEKIYLY